MNFTNTDDYFSRKSKIKSNDNWTTFINWFTHDKGWISIFIYAPAILYLIFSIASCDYKKLDEEEEKNTLKTIIEINSFIDKNNTLTGEQANMVFDILDTCGMNNTSKNIYNVLTSLKNNNWKLEKCSVYTDEKETEETEEVKND